MISEKQLAQAYVDVFKKDSPNVRLVMRDLAERCFAYKTTLGKTPEQTAANEGRRQVWLIIQQMAGLDVATIIDLQQETTIERINFNKSNKEEEFFL